MSSEKGRLFFERLQRKKSVLECNHTDKMKSSVTKTRNDGDSESVQQKPREMESPRLKSKSKSQIRNEQDKVENVQKTKEELIEMKPLPKVPVMEIEKLVPIPFTLGQNQTQLSSSPPLKPVPNVTPTAKSTTLVAASGQTTLSAPLTDSQSNHSISWQLFVPLLAGILALLAIILFISFLLYKKRNKERKRRAHVQVIKMSALGIANRGRLYIV